MAARDVSRRRLLGAGLGVGVATTAGGVGVPTARAEGMSAPEGGAAALPGSGPAAGPRLGCTPVSMSMHTHSCFSEGGSFAGGGGGASMLAQLDQATRTHTEVVWWTDHDWRMEAYGYMDSVAFDGTDEKQTLRWTTETQGPVTGTQHTFVDEPHSPAESGKAMRVQATGTSATQWGTGWLWMETGNSFYSTNLTDTTLTVDVLAEQVGPDAEVVVQIETSFRQQTAGRPAGVYVLEYRVGTAPFRGVDGALTGVVTVPVTGDWQTLQIHPVDDIAEFWPDLVAEDSGLARLRFGIRARGGATGRGVFDRLRITRTRDQVRWGPKLQRNLMERLGRRYPHITQLMSAEVSMVRHMNVFMKDFELFPYPDRGKAPGLINTVKAAQEMVEWYHERGALVQYNHPPTNATELVASRALGADLMETVDSGGNFNVTDQRLNLLDIAARNAIFLTATSQNDDHAGRDWTQQHLFHSSVWTESKSIDDLLAGLAHGQVFLNHAARWPTGGFDMVTHDRRAMGRVIKTGGAGVAVDVYAENLPEGARVDFVVGVCDLSGAATAAVERTSHPAASFADGPMAYDFEKADGRYLRLEAFDATGVLIGIGNPLWLLPDTADVTVPGPRMLKLPQSGL